MSDLRTPPHNDDAERSVLGAALQNKDALFDVMELVRESDFYRPENAEIYSAMAELYRNNDIVDLVTVSEILKKRNMLERVGGISYLGTLSAVVPSPSAASKYAAIMAEKMMLRSLITASSEILEDSYKDSRDATDILDKAEQEIFEIAKSRQGRDYVPISDVIKENINDLEQLKGRTQGALTGITTGFRDIDRMTSGLQRSDMIVLAARPSVGKTSFALNVALNAALKDNASVLVFSLEMSAKQLGQRMLATMARVELGKIRDGSIFDDTSGVDRIVDAEKQLANLKIYIDDTPGISIGEMKNKCRRLKSKVGLDLIVIDYLQLMDLPSEKKENRQQEISMLSRMIKQLARDTDAPVLILSQLSRAVESRGKNATPMLSDLRDSGAIEQDADIVMFIAKGEHMDEEDAVDNIRRILIEKHRNGSTGEVQLAWLGHYTMYGNLDFHADDRQQF
ncbi:MAG: replicative DNA helicase [Clostridiales Family XIII bacterium]|nr:replicative DNA helicase [Clostridiales Family XIII bacterium]